MNLSKQRIKKYWPLILILFVMVFSGGYTYWNEANPEFTCASCHEIQPAISNWQHSSHRELQCKECHGTAFSNGWQSLSEKIRMVVVHVSQNPEHHDIIMEEEQRLQLSQKCAKCHTAEHAKWSAGEHDMTYAEVFLDKEHNEMEPPYWDCFRCHGMFYDGDINDLVKRPDTKGGEWTMLQPEQADVHAIPCLACHQMHTDNEPVIAMQYDSTFHKVRNSAANLYVRTDSRYRNAGELHSVEMIDRSGNKVRTSEDAASKLCAQCHSPNAVHMSGTEDDHTPTGVHEGLSCISCHDPHSNSAQNSCSKCHADASANCQLDVTTMNTTYFTKTSVNDIHHVSCTDCHAGGIGSFSSSLEEIPTSTSFD